MPKSTGLTLLPGEQTTMSRLVREALSFSKPRANHIGAMKLVICHYHLTRAAA